MIKLMKTDNTSLQLLEDGDIILEVKGHSTILTVDNLEELRGIASHFWDANNLYHYTSEAKADRERHELEYNSRLANSSILNPTTTGQYSAPKY